MSVVSPTLRLHFVLNVQEQLKTDTPKCTVIVTHRAKPVCDLFDKPVGTLRCFAWLAKSPDLNLDSQELSEDNGGIVIWQDWHCYLGELRHKKALGKKLWERNAQGGFFFPSNWSHRSYSCLVKKNNLVNWNLWGNMMGKKLT